MSTKITTMLDLNIRLEEAERLLSRMAGTLDEEKTLATIELARRAVAFAREDIAQFAYSWVCGLYSTCSSADRGECPFNRYHNEPPLRISCDEFVQRYRGDAMVVLAQYMHKEGLEL